MVDYLVSAIFLAVAIVWIVKIVIIIVADTRGSRKPRRMPWE
jgi:hypothetical protein